MSVSAFPCPFCCPAVPVPANHRACFPAELVTLLDEMLPPIEDAEFLW
jgi:hypothetical protein